MSAWGRHTSYPHQRSLELYKRGPARLGKKSHSQTHLRSPTRVLLSRFARAGTTQMECRLCCHVLQGLTASWLPTLEPRVPSSTSNSASANRSRVPLEPTYKKPVPMDRKKLIVGHGSSSVFHHYTRRFRCMFKHEIFLASRLRRPHAARRD